MNPFSRAAKILEASAALSKKPPERDTLNSNCSELKQDHNVGPTGFYAESLRRDETHKAFYEGLRSTEDDPNAEGEDDEKQEEWILWICNPMALSS